MSHVRPLGRVAAAVIAALSLALSALAVTATGASAQKIRNDFWGMHDTDWTTAPQVEVGSANFTTSGTYWPRVQTGKRTFDWARLDAQVAAAEAADAQPMIVLGQSPRFASTKPKSAAFEDAPPKLKLWKKYVTKVANRYGTRLDYQVWPEPNIIQNWTGSPRQMATLTMVASKAITRAAGKKAKVVSPAVALRLKSQRKWTVSFFKQSVGGKRVQAYVDAVAIDPFPMDRGTPEDSYAIMRGIKRQLGKVGVRKPFWNNEINYGVAGGGEATDIDYSVPKQRSYVIRTYALSAAAKMQRTYWLGWFASKELAIDMADSSGNKLPAGDAYGVVRSWLNGTSFSGCSKKKSGLWVCVAKTGGGEVRRVYWKPSGSEAIKTPRSTTRVEDQEGVVDARGGAYRIDVDFRPIMVASDN